MNSLEHSIFRIITVGIILFNIVVIGASSALAAAAGNNNNNNSSSSAGVIGTSTRGEKERDYYVNATAEQRHKEHLAMGAAITEPYTANLNYTLVAVGSASQGQVKSSLREDARITLNLSVWKSTKAVVSMDIMNGTVKIGNNKELQVHSGHAYYLINSHLMRIIGYIIIARESAGSEHQPSSSQVQTLKLIGKATTADDARLPAGTGSNQQPPLKIQILAAQSKLAPGWSLDMNAEVRLERGDSSSLPPQTTGQEGQKAAAQKKQVTLTAILDNLGDEERFHALIDSALQKLRERHPDLDIQVVEKQFAYPEERNQLIKSVANGTEVDLMSVDQIWLGELAEKGLLTDLGNYTKSWGRALDWYQSNWDGGAYKGKTYGIWVWTDVRGMYYWKDLLEAASVDPDSLKTWDGYIESAKKLDASLRPKGIEGVHLTGASHSPDLWYPYLWMLGGDILEQKSGHPTKGVYWFPAYNSSKGVEALTFLKHQVDAGIVPQKSHFWGKEFADKKFAVMIEASHVPGEFSPDQKQDLDKKVGFIPMLPVPNQNTQTTTLMGGWELSIPVTSRHKELAWELISLMVEPEILAPWLAKYNYLPTQLPIGEGPYSQQLRQTNPFFDDMVSMIQHGRSRPSIPEYPQIAEHIREAIDDVYYGKKEPKQALDDAAAKSAQALGWK
ncbi:ABC-type sugar transport system, periplasmic component [Candidatus Nitrososphaera evergladensis SR1]|uniref:ABC-type sugar transport system, periplasmic component n=1 Tax=Candidatus Nitrososphaera evergladensis SR1 TaxID=1459636 RepID=A0A075MQS2_9ARCH|nr:extracellular solute-binding protein [Candidatus Nitrososphaera evergladensis]AIF83558.1 ABC-type sugar transport system, periplasmic component [Candidatus Nitrososphaera evergladensis SR1]